MKRLTIVLVTIVMVSTAAFAQDQKKTIGLTIGTDWYSNYLFHGTDFYNGKGAFAPYISWNALNGIDNAGELVISIAGELAQDQQDFTSFKSQSLDFGLDYSITLGKLVNLGVGAWYWMYLGDYVGLTGGGFSFLSLTASVGFDVILQPTVTYTHEMYLGSTIGSLTDFYLSISIGHEFDLGKGVSLGLGLSYGMYNYGAEFRALNDITATLSLGFNVAGVTIGGEFGAMYVHYETQKFKSYFKVGASYAL